MNNLDTNPDTDKLKNTMTINSNSAFNHLVYECSKNYGRNSNFQKLYFVFYSNSGPNYIELFELFFPNSTTKFYDFNTSDNPIITFDNFIKNNQDKKIISCINLNEFPEYESLILGYLENTVSSSYLESSIVLWVTEINNPTILSIMENNTKIERFDLV